MAARSNKAMGIAGLQSFLRELLIEERDLKTATPSSSEALADEVIRGNPGLVAHFQPGNAGRAERPQLDARLREKAVVKSPAARLAIDLPKIGRRAAIDVNTNLLPQ